MKVYTAGSISGKTLPQVLEYFSNLQKELESYGYGVLNPMSGKAEIRVNEKYLPPRGLSSPTSTDRAIIGRDRWMVGQSDIVYVNLESSDIVSIGTMFEMAWAYELRKHIVTVIPQKNIHEHAFPLMATDIRFETSGEALAYLKNLAESLGLLRG